MSTYAKEVAFFTGRIARSIALAEASIDICARASHTGIARAYGVRLAALDHGSDASTPRIELSSSGESAAQRRHALSRSDNEGGALAHDHPTSAAVRSDLAVHARGEQPQISARIVVRESVVVALLAVQ